MVSSQGTSQNLCAALVKPRTSSSYPGGQMQAPEHGEKDSSFWPCFAPQLLGLLSFWALAVPTFPNIPEDTVGSVPPSDSLRTWGSAGTW